MATLDELFAEAGLSAPQRTNRNRTVTTPGSYEAPVEGIQDYGAFQRGFTTGITFNLYLLAKSKSLWSCAGHPNIAPVP